MKAITLILGIIMLLAISGCGNNTTGKAVHIDVNDCEAPYVKIGDVCCVDENTNGICDIDELSEEDVVIEEMQEDEAPLDEVTEVETETTDLESETVDDTIANVDETSDIESETVEEEQAGSAPGDYLSTPPFEARECGNMKLGYKQCTKNEDGSVDVHIISYGSVVPEGIFFYLEQSDGTTLYHYDEKSIQYLEIMPYTLNIKEMDLFQVFIMGGQEKSDGTYACLGSRIVLRDLEAKCK